MFEWHEFRPKASGYKKVLGPLEADIMEVMWVRHSSTAREVYDTLKKRDNSTRRSTISIMMNRLCDRGLLEKKIDKGRGGLRYVYTTRVKREDFDRKVVEKVMGGLMETFKETTFTYWKGMR